MHQRVEKGADRIGPPGTGSVHAHLRKQEILLSIGLNEC